jgi:cyclic pyranopterin phosphate synthase
MRLTHVDDEGNARMVDVGDKPLTRREAVAEGVLRCSEAALRTVIDRTNRKGDVLAIAQLAGIQGAKQTASWVPLCHPLPLDGIDITVIVDQSGDEPMIRARASVRTTWRTGVEMEALCAVSAALLCAYDMLKAVDKAIVIDGVRLVEKRGGRSGDYVAGA